MDPGRLIKGLRGGEESAWREFISGHGRIIYAVAAKLGMEGADRDDLFQATCLAVMEQIHTLKDPTRLASWLYSVSYRLGIDTLRRRRPEVVLADAGGARYEPRQGSEEGVLVRLGKMEQAAQLWDALARLDPRCRNLLTALYLEDPRPSYIQISRREAMPVGSIGPTRARCLKKLFEIMKGLSKAPPPPSAE